MVLLHTAMSMLSGIVTVVLCLVIFRKKSLGVWGWIASFFPDMPLFTLAFFGATNLGNVLLFSHTAGVLIFPIFLVLIDVLLIEIGWLKYISWMPYPKYMKNVRRVESIVEKLEKYNAIPRPARVKRVYLVGILAGVVHLTINLLAGAL